MINSCHWNVLNSDKNLPFPAGHVEIEVGFAYNRLGGAIHETGASTRKTEA